MIPRNIYFIFINSAVTVSAYSLTRIYSESGDEERGSSKYQKLVSVIVVHIF